jgi:hypothetical protein
MGITENPLTRARLMATTALSGFLTDSLSERALGTVDTVGIMDTDLEISMTAGTTSAGVVSSVATLDVEDTGERVSAAKVDSEAVNHTAEVSAVKAASEVVNHTAEVSEVEAASEAVNRTEEAAREVEATAAVVPTVEAAHMVEVTARLLPNYSQLKFQTACSECCRPFAF